MKLLLWALALLALVSAPNLALGYYDPGVQRWINRDPRQEWSAINMYTYTANEPVASVDPSGLAVWKCTRTTDAGVGRHAYLWDDRPGPREHSCGMGASGGRPGRTSHPKDRGPNTGGPQIPYPYPPPVFPPVQLPWNNGDYHCVSLPGTDGNEDRIMDHCRRCINAKVNAYVPVANDCHTACDAVLNDLGIGSPPLPKTNPWDIPIIIGPILRHRLVW